MAKILNSVELFKGIHYELNHIKRDNWYDLYNFMDSYNLIRDNIRKDRINNFYQLKLKRKPRKARILTENNEKVLLTANNNKDWQRGFKLKGSYEIIVKPTIGLTLIDIEEQYIDKLTLYYIENEEKQQINFKDIYLLTKMSGVTKHEYSYDYEIHMFDKLYMRFTNIGTIVRLHIQYINNNDKKEIDYLSSIIQSLENKLDNIITSR